MVVNGQQEEFLLAGTPVLGYGWGRGRQEPVDSAIQLPGQGDEV